MRTGTGRFGTGGSRDDGGSLQRSEIYGEAALYRRRYELARAEADQLRHERRQFERAAAFIKMLRPWSVAVPVGQHATGDPAFIPPPLARRPTVVRVPTQRVAPEGVPTRPRPSRR